MHLPVVLGDAAGESDMREGLLCLCIPPSSSLEAFLAALACLRSSMAPRMLFSLIASSKLPWWVSLPCFRGARHVQHFWNLARLLGLGKTFLQPLSIRTAPQSIRHVSSTGPRRRANCPKNGGIVGMMFVVIELRFWSVSEKMKNQFRKIYLDSELRLICFADLVGNTIFEPNKYGLTF